MKQTRNIAKLEHDKPRLHEDAKRLFLDEQEAGMNLWDTTYSPHYKSRKQADRHADRDGTAFASVALPAHYSVVFAILKDLRHRLGSEWAVRHILEWGSGVGSGLWYVSTTMYGVLNILIM